MAWDIAEVLDQLDETMETSLNAVFNALLTQNIDFFWLAATLSFMLLTWRFLTPGSGMIFHEYIQWIVRLFIITTFMMNAELANKYFWIVFWDTPETWAAAAYTALTGEVWTSGNALLVRLVDHTIIMVMDAFASASSWYKRAIVAIFALLAGGALFWLIYRGLRYILLAKFSHFIMFAASPAFAVFGLFEKTRPMVFAWLNIVVQASLLKFFIYFSLGLFVNMLKTITLVLEGTESISLMASALTGLALFAFLAASLIDKLYVYAQAMSSVVSMGSFNRGHLRDAASRSSKFVKNRLPGASKGAISKG